MQHNNGRRNNNNNNNRRFKNNNQNKRRFGGGGGSGFDDESQNISMQQRKNFANKRDQYLVKAKDCLSNGERVEAENYFQHADHCFRMMNLGLKDGARFDPQRMSIQNPNHQQHHHNNHHDNHHHDNGADVNDGVELQQSSPQADNSRAESADDAGISSLPFLQAPIELDDEPRIIE